MNRGKLAIFGVAVFFVILFGGLTLDSAMAAPPPKVDVCHNGDDGLETITISEKAVEKHEAHGDHIGACFVCGDGHLEGVETCDDGTNNGSDTFCNATCDGQTEYCGDGLTTGSEACDEGDANEDSTCGCNDSCQYPDTSVVCRVGSGDVCDPDEFCDGAGLCPVDEYADGPEIICRVGSGDFCDPDEACIGVAGAACPADVVTSAGIVCNAGSGDVCDPDEMCTGAAGQACPADTVASGVTVCNAGSGDICDPDELCTGVADAACPADTVASAGTLCRAGSGDVCDPGEACTGVQDTTCAVDAVADDGTACGIDGMCSVGICEEPVCGDGILDAGEQCDDGNAVTEVCGYDEPSCTVCASDCTEQSGATSFCGDGNLDEANGEQCDDGNEDPYSGCLECQLPTGTGTILLAECNCDGVDISPNMCIESVELCTTVNLAPICGPLCLAAPGSPTYISGQCQITPLCSGT